jgi:hypothetical protein
LHVESSGVTRFIVKNSLHNVSLRFVASSDSARFGAVTNHPIVFDVNNTDAATLGTNGRFRIGSTGSVTDPAYTLEVRSAGNPDFALANSDLTKVWRNVFVASDDTLRWQYNGTERFRITSDGNVGIGTTAPSGKLHVVDSAFAGTLLMERNGQTSDSTFSAMRLMTTKTTNMNDGFGSLIAFLIKDNAGVENNVGFIGAVRAGADNTGDLVFAPAIASVYTERMRLTSGGNLGIGTTTPSAKIHALATTEQLRLGYDTSNYLSATVGSTGSTTFALTGTTPIFTFSQAVKFSGGTQSSDGSAGLSATYNIDGSAAGTVATMTFKNGLLTAVTTR